MSFLYNFPADKKQAPRKYGVELWKRNYTSYDIHSRYVFSWLDKVLFYWYPSELRDEAC